MISVKNYMQEKGERGVPRSHFLLNYEQNGKSGKTLA